MYVSSFMPLQSALTGVEAAQEELDVTGNNIANAGNAGYQEETVTLAAAPALNLADGAAANGVQLGTGVDVSGVANSDDPYLDNTFRSQNASTSSASTMQDYLQQIQSALGENNNNPGAISTQLSTFWNNWTTLADNPTNSAAAQAVVEDGQSVATTISGLANQLNTVSTQAQNEYANLTAQAPGGEVYEDVQQIATLNTQIAQAVAGHTPDNQLLDQRGKAIDDLSSLANVTVTDNPDGTVDVGFGGISNLVAGGTVNWPTGSSFTFPGAASTVGGKLGALLTLTSSGGTIDTVASELDTFATGLANAVNSPTVNGSTVTLNPPFFTITTGGAPGSAAASLAVNPSLVSNPSAIQTGTSGSAGDNSVALAEAANAGGPVDQSYTSFVEQVGGMVQSANNAATRGSALLTQATNQRTSAEGVDLNQEMTNLIQEQQAYQASAKVMNAFSAMMDALLQAV